MGIKFDLDPQEADIIATALGQQPWVRVDGLMKKLMAQANDPKMQNQEAPPCPPTPTE